MTIKFHTEARIEFFEAADYYEEQEVGLGDDFVDEVDLHYSQILYEWFYCYVFQ